MNFENMRLNYDMGTLERQDLNPNPIAQFQDWFELARAKTSSESEANAMVLATADADGVVSARTVLLKSVDEGFVFYSNYDSVKARALLANPKAALVFYWHGLQRQVRVQGSVEKVDRELSNSYFQSRPYGSQIGAWLSPQSQAIPSRSFLEERQAEMEARFPEANVALPDFWGGYRLLPNYLEFWQGRVNRLHDRFAYTLSAEGEWLIERLAP